VKGEILYEGKILGGELFLLFSIPLILFNKPLSFLCHFNSWFLIISPTYRIFKGKPVFYRWRRCKFRLRRWSYQHSFGHTQLVGLLELKNSEVQEIPSFHKLQYTFMSMERVVTHWFYIWGQKNPDLDCESFSTTLIKRFKDSYGSHVFERLTTLKQEEQIETETHIEERETSTLFLKERTNDVPELKKMLQ